jgi:hypothetical protein
MSELSANRTRPGWVWVIFVWYTLAFVFAAVMEYLFLSKSLPQTPQLEASLSQITTFDYLDMNAHLLLSQAAAVVLFLLRRQATYLFWALLVFNAASNIFYHYIRTDPIQPNKFVGGGMSWIAIGANLAICLYCEHLKRNGTLT